MASAVTETLLDRGNVKRVRFSCVANAADGLFDAYTVLTELDGKVCQLVTNPGSPAPASNYDITLTNEAGVDVLQSAGLNRHTSNSEMANVVFSSTSINPVVAAGETLILNISGTTVNSAETVIDLYIKKGG